MKGNLRRMGALLLLLAMLVGMLPQTVLAAAADYTQPYLNQLVNWGFMRGDIDGNLNPDNNITRAEFVTIINRAFGYETVGATPFNDVEDTDWYAEDVAIAYTAGYITGTSANTFSPLAEITREEAAVILARNLMMQPAVGENTDFTDGRDLSNWSSGLVSTAARYNLLSGYPDGSFRPQNPITRGEVAIMVTKAVGTPVQEPGEHTLGSVYGNVVISKSGVTLRDTVIAGNLYITSGVDLGDVQLENVTVLGEIVVSGGGVSEGGDDSVILRNVDAPKLIVDNIKNQQVSLRVEGDGVIGTTSVRTDSFIADNTPAGYGLSRIELDGEEESSLKLAGNVKEVVNLTPGSSIDVAAGQVETVTVDEKATDSTLSVTAGAQVGNVNLDVGTTVTGDGDIANLTVNANDSTVSMLPDQIVVRPGVTATIDGEQMDSAAAAESSADPRLLAGYPQVTDLAPTSATVSFSANKRGTIYWAISSVTDGSIGVDELINPQSYATKVVKQGTLTLGGASQPGAAKISGLTSDGSYYLSTVLVDARGDQSPLKVISFTTPDNSVPNFATDYPYLSRITNISAQVTAMTTKTCRLYWALLPKGSAAPTASDFKANAVTGNLGFGTLDVTKNTPYTFDVNSVPLEELESYDLYLWLTDVDGAQSSAVKKLSFTTVDKTPPVFNTEPTINKVDRTSVGMYANLNEAGTLYWVVVAQGEEYPKPLAGQTGAVDLASDTAKLQVSAGMNALKSGSVSMAEGRDVNFNVSGLEAEKAYDLYYVAKDTAGNFSATVKKITIHTLDPNAPTVTQEFTRYPGEEAGQPYPNTDIRLVFSEEVQDAETNITLVEYSNRVKAGAMSREDFAAILRDCIEFYEDTGNGRPEQVIDASNPANSPAVTDKNTQDWVIDYRYAEATLEEGHTVVTFPTTRSLETSALNLASGGTYHFEIPANTVSDTSDARNAMGRTTLDEFTTVFAIVNLSNPNEAEFGVGETVLDGTTAGDLEDTVTFPTADDRAIDISWMLSPESTTTVAENINWDMILWFNVSVEFDLYARENTSGERDGTWALIGRNVSVIVPPNDEQVGVSLTRILRPGNNPRFDPLQTLDDQTDYEYAVHFTRVGTLTDRNSWSQRIEMGVTVLAGATDGLQALAMGSLTKADLEQELATGLINIGMPNDFTLRKQFNDQTAPVFTNDRPTFEVGDSLVNMSLSLNRPGTVFYVVAPIGTVPTRGYQLDEEGKRVGDQLTFSPTIPENATEEEIAILKQDYNKLYTYGNYDDQFAYPFEITAPTVLQIVNADYTNNRIKYGSVRVDEAESVCTVQGLDPLQDYVVYFVIQGTSSQVYSDQVYVYRFTTSNVEPAYITLRALNPEVEFRTSQDANLYYALYAPSQLPTELTVPMKNYLNPDTDAATFEASYGNLTVLEAMCQTLDEVGRSLFDVYASDSIKETIRIILQSQTGGGSLDQGNFQAMTQNRPEEHDFTDAMDPNSVTMYVCLATAQNVLGGEWAFKAVNNVCIPDDEAPILVYYSSNGLADPGTGLVSGTFTVRFNEVLYYMPEGGDSNSVEPIVRDDHDVDGVVDQVGFLNICELGTSTGWAEYTTHNTSPTNTYTIRFWNFRAGDTISFPTSGQLTDIRGNTNTNRQYTFTLRETDGLGLIVQGEGKYEFVLEYGEYEPDT